MALHFLRPLHTELLLFAAVSSLQVLCLSPLVDAIRYFRHRTMAFCPLHTELRLFADACGVQVQVLGGWLGRVCACVRACACVRVCVCACACVCVRVCVKSWVAMLMAVWL